MNCRSIQEHVHYKTKPTNETTFAIPAPKGMFKKSGFMTS